MPGIFDHLVEQRIAQAQAEGHFDDLPGKGKPLAMDDDALVPEELRMAYRVLRNAGFTPPEVAARRQIADLRAAAVAAMEAGDEAGERQARRRMLALVATLEARGSDLSSPGLTDYAAAVRSRIAGA